MTGRVAIVDDDPRIRESLGSLFDAARIEAHFFSSAEDFLEQDLGQFACVVSDVKMAGMPGYDLQRHLLERQSKISFIFISAYPDDQRVAEAMSLGAIAFLQKPFDGEELLEWVERAFNSPK